MDQVLINKLVGCALKLTVKQNCNDYDENETNYFCHIVSKHNNFVEIQLIKSETITCFNAINCKDKNLENAVDLEIYKIDKSFGNLHNTKEHFINENYIIHFEILGRLCSEKIYNELLMEQNEILKLKSDERKKNRFNKDEDDFNPFIEIENK